MLSIRKLIAVTLLCLFCANGNGATSSSEPLVNFYSAGSVTAAGIAATLQVAGVDGYNILLDGTAVGTSTITVSIQVLDPDNSTYVTPATINGVANPITLTNGTAQLINVPGALAGIQVNVTSFGTATGTFATSINAY